MTGQQNILNSEFDQEIESLSAWKRMRLIWRLTRDQRVAGWMKGVVPAIAVAYVVSPVDVIPDWILGFGQLDDAGVVAISLLVATKVLLKLAPKAVVEEHLTAMGVLGRGRRQNRHSTVASPIATIDGDVIETTFRVSSASKNPAQ